MAQQVSIPPQAYTRETIIKAYEWLKQQPENLREQANSVDRLVSLYLYAQRQSDAGLTILDPPEKWSHKDLESVEHFKSDLKNLAQGLKQFEKTSASSSSQFHRPPTKGPEAEPARDTAQIKGGPSMSSFTSSPNGGLSHNQGGFVPPVSEKPSSNGFSGVNSAPFVWDEKSAQAIRSTRERFNLSSDQEAIRMLISLGFENLRDRFSRGF